MEDISKYSETVKVLALCRYAGVGPRLFSALMARYGSLDGIFMASVESLQAIENLNDDAAELVERVHLHLPEAQAEYDRLREREIRTVTRFDAEYPKRFEELNDPPPLLYVRGRLPANERKTVTLAGSSEATNQGIELTVQLARRFAEAGVQVVSSLRKGIDAAAHIGARAVNGESFAVLESGFDQIDATEQLPLAIDTLVGGGVMAELAPAEEFGANNYIEANRLLAGLSDAVVVTEIYRDSEEAMDLIEFCGQVGKLVFVVAHGEHGVLSDEEALARMTEHGAVPLEGPDQADKIIAVLV